MTVETVEVERQVTHTEEEEMYVCDSCSTEIEEDQDMIVYEVSKPWGARGSGEYNEVHLHKEPCAGNMDWIDPSMGPTVKGSTYTIGFSDHTIRTVHSTGSLIASFVGASIVGLFGILIFSHQFPGVINTGPLVAIGLVALGLISMFVTMVMFGNDDKTQLVKENF